MSLLDESGADPIDGEATQPDTGADIGGGMDHAPEWLKTVEGVDPDLVGDPSLKALNNVGDLVKSYVNAQKLIGKDKVILPTEKSSEVEWNQFWDKMGRPEKADDYKFDLGEQKSFDDSFMGKFAELAHKHNILPNQAQALLKELNEFELSQDQNFQSEIETKVNEAKQELQRDWGDAYQSNVQKAVDVVKEFGGEDMLEHFKQTGYGSDPKFLNFLVKIAQTQMGEDTIDPGRDTRQTGLGYDEVQRRINESYRDPAYLDKGHPDHKRKVEEVQRYFKLLHKFEAQAGQAI